MIPCFNHGRYLRECLDAVRAQTWPEIEIVVVDDASTEPDTRAVLDELERGRRRARDPPAGERRARAAARNAGLERSRGRYVLPVDADNLLLPDAVERLVAQLTEAGEDVGFIYPNLQYFGNRRDYFEAPPYNLYALLHAQLLRHLLARRPLGLRRRASASPRTSGSATRTGTSRCSSRTAGSRASPRAARSLRYRKHGFTRSDAVEHGAAAFHDEIRERHPSLYGHATAWGRMGPADDPPVAIKARWSPGLSVVALEPADPATEAGQRLAAGSRARPRATPS